MWQASSYWASPAAFTNLSLIHILALFIAVCSVLAVTTSRILRAATYLLFVLFGTAGIYFQLNYSFLGAVQLLIYAGGITVLYVFSIQMCIRDSATLNDFWKQELQTNNIHFHSSISHYSHAVDYYIYALRRIII